MTYLDAGCLVKLYYPEPDSAKIAALIQGKVTCHTPSILSIPTPARDLGKVLARRADIGDGE